MTNIFINLWPLIVGSMVFFFLISQHHEESLCEGIIVALYAGCASASFIALIETESIYVHALLWVSFIVFTAKTLGHFYGPDKY